MEAIASNEIIKLALEDSEKVAGLIRVSTEYQKRGDEILGRIKKSLTEKI